MYGIPCYKYSLISNGIKPDDVDKCMSWAFGDNFGTISIIGSHVIFNNKHPECEQINGYDRIETGYEKIARSYLAQI